MWAVSERRRLVLVVGHESPARRKLANELLAHGHSVFMCPGPPGCPLLREERCPLVEVADLALIMPSAPAHREAAVGLGLCAGRARKVMLVGPSAVDPPPDGAMITRSSAVEAVAGEVDALLWEGYASFG